MTSNSTELLSGEGEEDDESSRSVFHMKTYFESALEEFRENWQHEIETAQNRPDKKNSKEDSDIIDETIHDKSERLFKIGIDLEQKGKVYDALQYYRRAVQLVPDIEFRIYDKRQFTSNNIETNKEDVQSKTNIFSIVPDSNGNHEKENLEGVNLFQRFKSDLGSNMILSSLDEKVVSTQLQISDLPTEILFYILKWIVSNKLDLYSLEQVSATCKGLYLCARDEDIWRQICIKIWGFKIGNIRDSTFSTWREMCIKKERVHFNGCYISKTSYLRYGENSFQDEFYRPMQLIIYYRYIRFLPDGEVFMMTNTDEPHLGVSRFQNLDNVRPDVLKGEWRLHGNIVIIMFSKSNNNLKSVSRRRGSVMGLEAATASTRYYIELTIGGTKKKKFCKLQWNKYYLTQKRFNGSESTTEFELTNSKFPPLWFSKVKSYHTETNAPL